jgi:non-heme chloroperoxidase
MAQLEVEPGQHIYYEHYRGTGSPVVLVHGWGMSVRIWDLTLPALLEAGHEVIAFDHRCCGRSDKDFDVVTTASIAGDLVKLVQHTGVTRPVLLGWSFGAAAAAEAAGTLGDAIGGLVLVGPPTPRYTQTDDYPHGGTADILAQTLTALRDTRPDFLWALTQGVCHQEISPEMLRWQWDMFMQSSPRADAALADLGTLDHRALLPTIKAPALVCFGSHDAVVDPAIAGVCADLLPASRRVEFTESGHAPFLEERARFDEELRRFLEGL